MTTVAAIATEVRRLHDGFERWFRGDAAFDFEAISQALADDFSFFAPNGVSVVREHLVEDLRNAFASRDIPIRIEQVEVIWEHGTATLAAYEEWHDHPNHSTARRSTVLLTRVPEAPGGFLWHHVHETWIHPPPG